MVVTLDADALVADADGADAQLSPLRSRLVARGAGGATAAAGSAGAPGSRRHVPCAVSCAVSCGHMRVPSHLKQR